MFTINLKNRIKNLNFWVGLTAALALFVQTVLELMHIQIETGPLWELLNTLFSVLAAYGVLIDPSTPGASDHPIVSEPPIRKTPAALNISGSLDSETLHKILKGERY